MSEWKKKPHSCTRSTSKTLGPKNHGGFVLITTLMVLVLLMGLTLSLHVRVLAHWVKTVEVDSFLRAAVQAQNGLSFARNYLPTAEINALLVGPNERSEITESLRNPHSISAARSVPIHQLPETIDDGLLPLDDLFIGDLKSNGGRGEAFFIRFSNDSSEALDTDENGVVLVRSMGITPKMPSSHLSKNTVVTLESTLRKELAFATVAPLNLIGTSAAVSWPASFPVHFDRSAIEVGNIEGENGLLSDVLQSIQDAFPGSPFPDAVSDRSPHYQSSPQQSRLLQDNFWTHFELALSRFESATTPGLIFLPESSRFHGEWSGIVVTRGDVVIEEQARISGILIHLGDGSLVIRGEALIHGAVWMSNFSPRTGPNPAGFLELQIQDQSQLIFSQEEVDKSLELLPPTQLAWRIIYDG